MNAINRIEIQNIKGRRSLNLEFNDFHANMVNLLVAPNGYGKSTIATAFQSLKPSKLELNKTDIFENNPSNEASLKVSFIGEVEEIFEANSTKNELSAKVYISVINSPIYAKSTSRQMGGFSTRSAVIGVEDLEIIHKIPKNITIPYSITEMKKCFPVMGKCFQNLSKIFTEYSNLEVLMGNISLIKKCLEQAKIQECLSDFIESFNACSSSSEIKSRVTQEQIDILKRNGSLNSLFVLIKNLEHLPFDSDSDFDVVLSITQLLNLYKMHGSSFREGFLYKEYLFQKQKIDHLLTLYNTTNRELKTKETNGKLVVEFPEAGLISNGERDVLSFICKLAKFEFRFNKPIGIIVIDEVFDYLDGCNILIAQYYLTQLIRRSKEVGKILYPVIFTHLDPNLFGNYYFQNMKIHYLEKYANCLPDDEMIKLLKLRDTYNAEETIKKKIEGHYLHYNPNEVSLDQAEKAEFSDITFHNSTHFLDKCYEDVKKYLEGRERYDPLKVICSIRVKIEQLLYDTLEDPGAKSKFINEHTTIKKLDLVEQSGYETNDLFYLLQPLYNDGLHMNNNENANKNKIKSACLKLDNYIVRKMVQEIFE